MDKRLRNALIIALCCLTAGTIVLCFVTFRRAHRAENTLRALHENAALSAITQLDDLKWHIDKALLSQDAGASAQLLSRASSMASSLRQSLLLMPASDNAYQDALKFANQLEDYALMLEGKVDEGALFQEADTLIRLSDTCTALMNSLKNTHASWDSTDAGKELPVQQQDQVVYPTLIYDGPFSDARTEGDGALLAALPEITREEALQCARKFLGDRVTALSPGTDTFGPIPCYGVTAQMNDMEMYLAVTCRGGRILWMVPDHASFSMEKTVEECRENALQFLAAQGYDNMEPLHFQVYEGLAVINFAARQGSVLLYPDQVKVQLRMDTGEVVGVECRSYITHHRPRGALTPVVAREEAAKAVSDQLALQGDGQLCLIPQNDSEVLCWEFRGEYRNEAYRVYINALTGQQQEILKMVETPYGISAV